MANNFTDDITEKLIQYMDNELPEDEQPGIEKMLEEQAEVNEQYQLLLAAKHAIRSYGLQQRVNTLQKEYLQNESIVTPTTAKVIKSSSFFTNFMRIAAVFIMVVAGYGVFEYSSTSDQSVFNNYFTNYSLPVNRGAANTTVLDSLYNAATYAEAIKIFEATSGKNQKDYFLGGQSYLHLNNATSAINAFEQVENLNNQSAEKYFVQETDYYLALAYIKAGNIQKAKSQLDKITANKQHMFYNQAKDLSGLKLTILKWKEK